MLVVMDLSGVGRCSALVVVPVLAMSGMQVSLLPTALLSTHTGGFGAVHRRDLHPDMAATLAHYKRLGLRFDAVYLGYVGHHSQLDLLEQALPDLLHPGGRLYVDPVMGDHGRPYAYCGPELVAGFKRLCQRADAVFPNRTEAALLLNLPVKEGQEPAVPSTAQLASLGARAAIVTGLRQEDQVGVLAVQDGRQPYATYRKLYPGSYPGTGDLLAASLIAALERGAGLDAACDIACDFLDQSLQTTKGYDSPAHFGLAFEPVLPSLAEALGKIAST